MNKHQIQEQLANGKISRRKFNKMLAALGATTIMMPMSSRTALGASGDHPTIFTWAGWEVPDFHGAYIDK